MIRGDGTWWWAGCLDRARTWLADHAKAGDLVLIANDDTQFGPDFLAAGRAALARHPRTLLLAQLHDGDTGRLVEVGGHIDWRRLKFSSVLDPAAVDCLSTRGLFLGAADFVRLGRFHRRLLPHYLSDFAFTIRAGRRGYALASDPGVRLWYDPSTTGIRSIEASSARAYLQAVFSKRSTDNPVYMSSFLLLAARRATCPGTCSGCGAGGGEDCGRRSGAGRDREGPLRRPDRRTPAPRRRVALLRRARPRLQGGSQPGRKRRCRLGRSRNDHVVGAGLGRPRAGHGAPSPERRGPSPPCRGDARISSTRPGTTRSACHRDPAHRWSYGRRHDP